MKTILLTYFGFQSLPKGVRRMLVATESFYYGETIPSAIYGGKKILANSKMNSHYLDEFSLPVASSGPEMVKIAP
jgi:hypothetical protein